MTTSYNNVKTFPVDIEHVGFRIALPLIMLIVGVAIWLGLSSPLDGVITNLTGIDSFGGFAAAALGMVGAIVAGVAADPLLKRYWPSGRALVVNPEAILLRDTRRAAHGQIALRLDRRINPTLWRFTVKRSTPKAQAGWVMLAAQLGQDETQLIVYTFMPPKQIKELPIAGQFATLIAAKDKQMKTLGVRETAEQRRLHKSEEIRWERGAELRPDDFKALLADLIPRIEALKSRLD